MLNETKYTIKETKLYMKLRSNQHVFCKFKINNLTQVFQRKMQSKTNNKPVNLKTVER